LITPVLLKRTGDREILQMYPMSTTSHKSNTRILSEKAMQTRVHTSRKDRDLTVDGLDKHHHEGTTLRVLAEGATVKAAASATRAKNPRLCGE
jgi:hypothetical protein